MLYFPLILPCAILFHINLKAIVGVFVEVDSCSVLLFLNCFFVFFFLCQNNLDKPLKIEMVDTSSGVLFPFYDDSSCMVYLAGKVRERYICKKKKEKKAAHANMYFVSAELFNRMVRCKMVLFACEINLAVLPD